MTKGASGSAHVSLRLRDPELTVRSARLILGSANGPEVHALEQRSRSVFEVDLSFPAEDQGSMQGYWLEALDESRVVWASPAQTLVVPSQPKKERLRSSWFVAGVTTLGLLAATIVTAGVLSLRNESILRDSMVAIPGAGPGAFGTTLSAAQLAALGTEQNTLGSVLFVGLNLWALVGVATGVVAIFTDFES